MNQDFNWKGIQNEVPDLCGGCNDLEDAIGRCDSLEKLFALWKAAHTSEENTGKTADDSRKSTFPDLKHFNGEPAVQKEIAKCEYKYSRIESLRDGIQTNFCEDGFLEEKENGCAAGTILFVFRESNISDAVKFTNGKIEFEPSKGFWLKNEWGQRKEEQEKSGNPYVRFIKQCREQANAEHMQIAVMNLNKRGGFGRCNHSRLQHYVEKYKPFIQREIELIKPSIIICGGTFGTVKDLLTNPLRGMEVWDCYHPGAWRQKDTGIRKWTFYKISE